MRQALLIACAVTVGCAAVARGGRAPASHPSQAPPSLVVTLRDQSPPSQPIRLDVSRAVARRDDGATSDLALVPRRPGEDLRETLWLEGEIPPGSYAGLDVYLAPDVPTRLDVPFVVASGTATVLEVVLRSAPDAAASERPLPVFESRPRPRPTTGLLGLVSVRGWDSVALFDKRTGALASLLAVGREPWGLAVDPERARAYVSVSGSDEVAALDLLEERVRERVPLRAGDTPRDLVLTPDGRTLVVANAGSDTVSFVDPISAIELERVAVAGRPSSLLMDPDGRRVFVLAERSSAITVLAVATRSAAGSIAVDSGPLRARFSGRNAERILVAHSESPYLTVLDARLLTVLQRVYVGPRARALEVDPRSGRIYLARARTGRVEVFDATSLLPVAEIPVSGEVAWMWIEPEGNNLGILMNDPAEARIMGLVGHQTVARTALGPDPVALRFVQGGAAY